MNLAKRIADFLAAKVEKTDAAAAAQLSAVIAGALTYGATKAKTLTTAKITPAHPELAALIAQGLGLL